MHRNRLVPLLLLVATGAVLAAQSSGPDGGGPTTLAVTPLEPSSLREWDGRVDRMVRSGDLALRTTRTDTMLAGRTHERYDQYVNGVRVFGADVARQLRDGVTESIFGEIQGPVAISTEPVLSEDDARARFAALAAGEFPEDRPVELVVLPLDEGGHRLTWRSHVWNESGWVETFLDAADGHVVLSLNALHKQVEIGVGTGVLGDRKKISTSLQGGRYVTEDRARPPQLITYDARGNPYRAVAWLNGAMPALSDIAADTDNNWKDGANVDAHVHLGWTYDYLYKRFGRRGLDDADVPLRAISHPVNRNDYLYYGDDVPFFFDNAVWCPPPCGPGSKGVMVFGVGLPFSFDGKAYDYFAGALDIVAHELAHGLTSYSSRLGGRNEPGALNEAFSDIIGTGTEFYFHQPGSGLGRADYLMGEDVVRPGGDRSMSDPLSARYPDHYSRRYVGNWDDGGVHFNATIPGHAFYLAIEGGVNRTSGFRVAGVGASNREQIEKVFYRAFVFMLPSNATFSVARAATIEAARDLYGSGSAPERAMTEAWTAVGVN